MAFAQNRHPFPKVAEVEPKAIQEAAAALCDAERKLGEAARHLDIAPTQPLSKDASALKDWAGYLLRDLTEFTVD